MAELAEVVTGPGWELPNASGITAPLKRVAEVVQLRPANPDLIAIGERGKADVLSFEAKFRADLAGRALVAARAGEQGLPVPFARLAEAARSSARDLRQQITRVEREVRPHRQLIRSISRDAGHVLDEVLQAIQRSAARMITAIEDVERSFRQLEALRGPQLRERFSRVFTAYLQAIMLTVDTAGPPKVVLEIFDETPVARIVVPVPAESELTGGRRAKVLVEIEERVEQMTSAQTDGYIVEFDIRGSRVAA